MIVLPAAVLMLKGQAFRLDRGIQHKLGADDLFHAGFKLADSAALSQLLRAGGKRSQ